MDIAKKVLLILVTGLLVTSLSPQKATAQWGVGASYEIRDEEPENGFGARIERQIFQKLPLVQLGLRAHFSYFNEENQLNYQNQSGTFSQEITDYDLGLTAVGGVSIGLLKPYVGVGLGSNSVNMEVPENASYESVNESSLYWNALIGAEINPIPVIKPFVEYRYTSVSKDFFEGVQQGDYPRPSNSNGRIIFGVMLRF